MTEQALRTSKVFLLPGWLDSGQAHWQSRWEALYGFERVQQDDWQWPRRGDWMARLDEVLQDCSQPAVLVAHSLGCQLVASWAAHSRHTAKVRAAFLAAPPDTERPDTPPQLFNWRPIVRQRLPFASLVVVSSDDPFCSLDRGLGMAADWGSAVRKIGARGHVNGESGLGDWPEGIAWLRELAGDRP
ncbi:RBBP9/YdeN family alpha/beta hydrolase [Piscinibacter terrae]|uniref:Alpha/beta hydrolase n=1 Tax=Piscinibacter terrae TaxID=2496871 RepID=A0A3N7JTK9_9BURK|nr:alpha/beta hydrolase [Albitalea terrae]RQP24279.1 alpha/beta hydrolase [Albitalea terrae]